MIKCYFDGKMKDCNISDCNTCKINKSEKVDKKQCIFEFCKHYKNCNHNFDFQCEELSNLFSKYNFDFVIFIDMLKNKNEMDLRDILERLNEIENSEFDLKLELYIKLRRDIENQIC